MTTKLHVACDALGNPVRFALTPGQHADVRYADTLLEGIRVGAVIADRGYDSTALVARIEAGGAEALIPSRRTNTRQRSHDANLYAERNKVERLIGRLKQHRRVATRYDKTAASYLGFVCMAAVLTLLQ